MRTSVALPFAVFFVVCAQADHRAERIAVGKAIASLNDPSTMNSAFTMDGDGWVRFEELRKSTPTEACRVVGPSKEGPRPTVTPSGRPWGEAGVEIPPEWRAWFDAIRFVTKDVALVEGACEFDDNGATRRKPLFLVVRRQGADWKIATLRLLAAP